MQLWLWRILVSPLTIVYGIISGIRNWMYDIRLLKSNRFQVPVIAVGNLSAGGAGKTPMVEYLLRLLHAYLHVGVISRGYGRKTAGYLEVNPPFDDREYGDEPVQFKWKYPEEMVAVCESRVYGMMRMMMQRPELQCILMDDAFQHRAVKAGMYILCTPYDNLYTRDWLLPGGTLREWSKGAERADLIIVTKCPDTIHAQEMDLIRKEIAPLPHQQVFFTQYRYGHPYHWREGHLRPLTNTTQIVLLTGIASTTYLKSYLQSKVGGVKDFTFSDHHRFTPYDVGRAVQLWKEMHAPDAMILTTEKDITRLIAHQDYLVEHKVPMYVLPVQVSFIEGGEEFDERIRRYLQEFVV